MPSWPKQEQPLAPGRSSNKKERRVVVSEKEIQQVRVALLEKSEEEVARDYRGLGMSRPKIQEALRQIHALEEQEKMGAAPEPTPEPVQEEPVSEERPAVSSDLAERVRAAVQPDPPDDWIRGKAPLAPSARRPRKPLLLVEEDLEEDLPDLSEELEARPDASTIREALLEATSDEELIARLKALNVPVSLRKELREAFRLRREREEAAAEGDAFFAVSPAVRKTLSAALKDRSAAELVEDAAAFGMTAAQMRFALRTLDDVMRDRMVNPDAPSADRAVRLRAQAEKKRKQVKAFMIANNTARLTDVTHGLKLSDEEALPFFEQFEREGFLLRGPGGRWALNKPGGGGVEAALALAQAGELRNPEYQAAAKMLPEIRKTLAATHLAQPEYLRNRFGLSDVQATFVLRTLREDGFLKETDEGELRVFPYGPGGESYPVIFPEDQPEPARLAKVPETRPLQPLEQPSLEPDLTIQELADAVSPESPQPLTRRKRGERQILGTWEPFVDAARGSDRVLSEPPTIDPLNPPKPFQPLPRRKRGERKILPSAPEAVPPDYRYQEPDVIVGAVPPAAVERDEDGKRVVPKPPRPYQRYLDEAAEKYRLKAPPAKAVEEAKARRRFWEEPFVYEEDVTEHAIPYDTEAEGEEVPDSGPIPDQDDRDSDAPPESGERVRARIDRAEARRELERLQHILLFAPQGADYAARRAELEQRIEAMKSLYEQAELEEERDVLRRRMDRIGEELEETAVALQEAEAVFQKAQTELLEKQTEATVAQTAYLALPGAIPLPKEYAARAKQLADWQKKAKAMPVGADRTALEELAAAFERAMTADRAVAKAKGVSREARQARDEAVARREALLQEFTEAEEKEKGLYERLKALDVLIAAGLAAGGIAAVKWEAAEEESAELKEIRKRGVEEAAAFAAAQEDKRKANEEAATVSKARWDMAKKVGGGVVMGGVVIGGALGAAFWVAGKAFQGLFYALRHPVKTVQFLWGKMSKMVMEGELPWGSKTKPPKGASPAT